MVQFASRAPHLVPKCPQKQQSRNFLANWQAFRKAQLHSYDILFWKSTALQIFSHWMWCLLTSNWIFAKKILWHQKQVFYQVIHSELGIRIYHSLSLFPLDLLSRGYSTMKFDFASKRRLLSPLLIAQSFTL